MVAGVQPQRFIRQEEPLLCTERKRSNSCKRVDGPLYQAFLQQHEPNRSCSHLQTKPSCAVGPRLLQATVWRGHLGSAWSFSLVARNTHKRRTKPDRHATQAKSSDIHKISVRISVCATSTSTVPRDEESITLQRSRVPAQQFALRLGIFASARAFRYLLSGRANPISWSGASRPVVGII